MRARDIDEIMAIERRAYTFHWTPRIFSDCLRVGYSCWVMLLNDAIGGYGVMSSAAGEAHLLNVCVAPEHQHQGYGRLLLEHFLALARERKVERMLLEVRPSNRDALRLYRATGFKYISRRRQYYPANRGREDAMVLALTFD
jgi:ribosomal-protein-alanine N-acetyltransferase